MVVHVPEDSSDDHCDRTEVSDRNEKDACHLTTVVSATAVT